MVGSEVWSARGVEWRVMAGWLGGREDEGRHCHKDFVVADGVLMGVFIGVDGFGGS